MLNIRVVMSKPFWWIFWGSPSLPVNEISRGGCLFCAIKIKRGVWRWYCLLFPVDWWRLCLLVQCLFFTSGFAGTFVKCLQLSYWLLWRHVWLIPESWSKIHFYFPSVSYSTFSVAHLYRGPFWSSYFPFMWRQNQVRGDFRILWSIADMRSNWLERHE